MQQMRECRRAPALRPGQVEPELLFVRWQRDRDSSAREELVRRYLPLARKLARKYAGAREPFDDLMQVASLGLVKAVDRFDARRGNAFSSFAVPTILGELKRYFRDCGWSAHVPRGAQELAMRVQTARESLTTKTGRSPTVPELAEYLELSVEEVVDGLETAAAHHASSLDAPLDDHDGEPGTVGDLMGADDERFGFVDATVSIAAAAARLSGRERHVLALRFFEDRTQHEIADQIGVSQMQVSRILRRATAQVAGAAGSGR